MHVHKFHLPLLAPPRRDSLGITSPFRESDAPSRMLTSSMFGDSVPKRLMDSVHLFSLNVALELHLESCEMNTRALPSPSNCKLRQKNQHSKGSHFCFFQTQNNQEKFTIRPCFWCFLRKGEEREARLQPHSKASASSPASRTGMWN